MSAGDDTTAVPPRSRADDNNNQNPQDAEIALGGEEEGERRASRGVVAQTASNAEGAAFPPPLPRGAAAAAGAIPGTAEGGRGRCRGRIVGELGDDICGNPEHPNLKLF